MKKRTIRCIVLFAFMALFWIMPQAMDVHAADIEATGEEKSYELEAGYNHINFTPQEDGIYTLFSDQDAFAELLDESGMLADSSGEWWSNGTEVKAVYTFCVEANRSYRLAINVNEACTRILALKKDSIESAKLTKTPDKLEYMSGYENNLDENGAEITIQYLYGGEKAYSPYGNSKLINWSPVYQGTYIYGTGSTFYEKRMEPGEQTATFSINGYSGEGLSYKITVKDESSVTKVLTDQENDCVLQSGNNYFKYEVAEDGFYALMANREGSYRCLSDYQVIGNGSWPDDIGTEGNEEVKAVASVYLEKGKTYLWEIWTASDKTLKLFVQRDEIVSADLIQKPDKVEYFSIQHNYSESQIQTEGARIGVTFKLSGVKEYLPYMPTDLIDWNPILPDGLKIQEEGPDNEPYLAVGEWTIKFRVNGLPEEDYPKYTIKVHDKTTIKDYLTETETAYTIDKNKYFLYTPSVTGYYGLLSDKSGSVTWSSTKYWTETDGKIKSLKWMKKDITYVLEVKGYGGTMNLAIQPVTIDSWQVIPTSTTSYKWNVDIYNLQNDFELKCQLSGGQEYLFDWSDKYNADIQVGFAKEVLGMYEYKRPAAGENTVVIDCHLGDKNPSYPATVTSIGDEATEIIPLGEETPVTAIQPEWEWESKYGYYKVKIEKSGWYDFSARNVQDMYLYHESNELIKSGSTYPQFTLQEFFGLELEAGKTYIIYCNNMQENPSIMIKQGGTKSLAITDFRSSYVQGINIREGRRVDFTDTTRFTITDQNDEVKEYGRYDSIWNSSQLTILVDGQKWNPYHYDENISYEPGIHTVELQYQGASDSFEFNVQTMEEHTEDLQELTDGIHTLPLSYSKTAQYRFVPQESAYYKIISLDEQGVESFMYGDEGEVQYSDSGDNSAITKHLEKGKCYLLNISLDSEGKSDVRVQIAPIPKIKKLELTNPPKKNWIAPLEETSDYVLLERTKLTITYEDDSKQETTYLWYDDFNSGFDIPNISYQWEEPIDWTKPGVYNVIFTEESSGLSVTAPVSLITFEQAEKDGLTGTIEVGKETRITPSERWRAKYYKLEGVTGGTYCIRGNATEKNTETGYYTANITVADKNGSLVTRDYWNTIPGEITKVDLSADETYYIAIDDYKENIFDWDILISEEKEITSAKLLKRPTKESYYTFEGFRHTGMEIEVTYSNGDTEIVTSDSALWNGVLTYSEERENGKLKITVGTGTSRGMVEKELFNFECTSKSIAEYPTYYELSQDKVKQLSLKTLEEERYIFAFTPEKDGKYTFEVNGGYDLIVNLCGDEELSWDGLIWDDANSALGCDFSHSSGLQGGHTYYFDVHFYQREKTGDFTVRVTGETTTHTHTFGDWMITQEATCEMEGEETRICVECDEKETRLTDPLGHEWSEEEILYAATCTEDGKKCIKCTRDGCDERKEYLIKKLGHNFSEEYKEDAPDLDNQVPGSRYRPCLNDGCNAKADETIIPLPDTAYAKAENAVAVEDENNLTAEEKDAVNTAVQEVLEESGGTDAEAVQNNLDGKTVSKLDQLYVDSNDSVADSEAAIKYSDGTTKEAKAEGVALTVGKYLPPDAASGTQYNAKLTINQTEETGDTELDAQIANGKACVLDINMSVVDEAGNPVTAEAADTQPVAPIKFTIPIPEEWNMTNFVLYHYKEDGTKDVIDYQVVDGNIVFTATSFSYYSMEVCNHKWVTNKEKGLAATCTIAGYKYQTCEFCKKTRKIQIEALGHDFGEWIVTKEATCTEIGNRQRVCSHSGCGKVQKEIVTEKGHDYKSVLKSATCTQEGESYSKCSLCGKQKGYYVIPKEDHTFETDWITVAPTCTAGGYDYRTCSSCGVEEKKNETNPLGHSYKVLEDKPVTCETDGIHKEACERCNNIISKTIPATGHNFTEWTIIEGSCVTGGKKIRNCKNANCGKVEEVVIPGTGHVYKMIVDKPATCEVPGSQHEECEKCHNKKAAVAIPATGHSFGEWTVTKEATCTETGNRQRVCNHSGCEKIQKEVISKKDHVFETNWVTVAPTCTTGGYDYRACSICGVQEKKNETKPLGHRYKVLEDRPATCEIDGIHKEACERCNNIILKTTPAIGHNFTEWTQTKAPTALVTGEETRTCATCRTQEHKPIKKLTAFVKLSATKLPLQVKKSTKVLKVTKIQKGDRVAYWKSSRPKTVAVNKRTGFLKAGKKTGKAVIYVKLQSGKVAKCLVTVQKSQVKTKSIKLSNSKLTIKRGKSVKLSAILNPLTSQDKVSYISSNKKVATVTSKGTIKGRKKGTAKITVKSGKKKVTCTVKVK